WSDLSMAGLIEGQFSTAQSHDDFPAAHFERYFPRARIHDLAYVAVFADTWTLKCREYCYAVGMMQSPGGGFTPLGAFYIDQKIDDAFPLRGKVVTGSALWESLPGHQEFLPYVDKILEGESSCLAGFGLTATYKTKGPA